MLVPLNAITKTVMANDASPATRDRQSSLYALSLSMGIEPAGSLSSARSQARRVSSHFNRRRTPSAQPQAYAISRADMQHRARRLFAGLLAQMYERENQYDREIIKHVCAMTEEGPRGAESLPRRKMYEAVPAI
jgi:hypothetical protein